MNEKEVISIGNRQQPPCIAMMCGSCNRGHCLYRKDGSKELFCSIHKCKVLEENLCHSWRPKRAKVLDRLARWKSATKAEERHQSKRVDVGRIIPDGTEVWIGFVHSDGERVVCRATIEDSVVTLPGVLGNLHLMRGGIIKSAADTDARMWFYTEDEANEWVYRKIVASFPEGRGYKTANVAGCQIYVVIAKETPCGTIRCIGCGMADGYWATVDADGEVVHARIYDGGDIEAKRSRLGECEAWFPSRGDAITYIFQMAESEKRQKNHQEERDVEG